ncbi:MAG: M1 family metallopeptidase [Ginsengibacter sp.]
MKHLSLFIITTLFFFLSSSAQDIQNNPTSNHGNKFEQLGTILPTPNEYRTASGAPGAKYWQQRCDYTIEAVLDDKKQSLSGKETLTYYNNSPDVLTYLWLQLDENEHSTTKNANYQDGSRMKNVMADLEVARIIAKPDKEYGVNIIKATDEAGKKLDFTVNKTMMRLELPQALKPGQKFVFKIDWNYNIADRMKYGGRGGYEYFPEDGNYLYTISQWYPRLCVYSDFQGWQNHQFTGRGEFALTFGNFDVKMTVPADHMVASTGECQNYQQVLSPAQYQRWQKAQTVKEPLEIATLDEAVKNEKSRSAQTKTWHYKADMVRDFAWTSSRKYIWDAVPAYVEGKKIMCMSFYGKEAYPIYRKFSTKAVAHTIKTYSKFSIPYPYPVAQSIEAANGMEYPMICFNYGRAEKDGTYSEATKNGMIGVVIHEVGHNFFPMIVNSDERQWTWMDEGLNSFLQYLAQELWDSNFPSGRGPAYKIVDYMKLPKDQLEPIMTNSENIVNFGPNAYAKPATGLNILRETIMGRELFDYSFREYARRWAFKHPTPADFFRTMEDASAEDLDWFWRGWFYGIDPCDISIDSVKNYTVDLVKDPEKKTMIRRLSVARPMVDEFVDITKVRNRDAKIKFETDADPALQDFYYKYGRGLVKVDTTITESTIELYSNRMTEKEKMDFAKDNYLYEIYFTNKGGLVMPVILEWTFKDGTKEVEKIPAQVWRKDEKSLVKVFSKNKEVTNIRLDPMRETADIDESNNYWPIKELPTKFEIFKAEQSARGQSSGGNPMQKEVKK